jgi:hypothetical protein
MAYTYGSRSDAERDQVVFSLIGLPASTGAASSYSSQGLRTGTPLGSKSATFRVTTVMP